MTMLLPNIIEFVKKFTLHWSEDISILLICEIRKLVEFVDGSRNY